MSGCQGYLPDAIRISPRSTGEQECAHDLGSACSRARIPTRLHAAGCARIVAANESKRSIRRRRSTHRLLRRSRNDGKQVRPWLAKPKMTAAPRVRESDWEPTSRSHQGQRHEAATKVRMYGCNLYSMPLRNEHLANRGRPCTVIPKPALTAGRAMRGLSECSALLDDMNPPPSQRARR